MCQNSLNFSGPSTDNPCSMYRTENPLPPKKPPDAKAKTKNKFSMLKETYQRISLEFPNNCNSPNRMLLPVVDFSEALCNRFNELKAYLCRVETTIKVK